MIIGINEKQEVIFTAIGVAEEANNETTFKVESKPEAEEGRVLCFDPETETFYHKDRPPVDEEAVKARRAKLVERRAAEEKKAASLKWLADNDWKINKHTLGEWTDSDPRWLEYVRERAKVRAEFDAADAILNT